MSSRQILISAVRLGRDVRGRKMRYDNLFILPINMISNKQIEHKCYKRYMGYTGHGRARR